MTLKFHKYQATGNDFVMVDNREGVFEKNLDAVKYLCDRKFGIGSDGLILIENHDEHDFEMVFYNPDGSQSLCGNGSRCAVNFAKELGIVSGNTNFLAYDGLHNASIEGEIVKLKMGDVQNVMDLADGMFVDTGSPHLIQFVINIDNCQVLEEGRRLRNGGLYQKNGVNVNFVEVKGESDIFVRTYERGVENETLSCGTGVTAAAIASGFKDVSSPVNIRTRGGDLQVSYTKNEDGSYTDIYLIGPAKKVFEGNIIL